MEFFRYHPQYWNIALKNGTKHLAKPLNQVRALSPSHAFLYGKLRGLQMSLPKAYWFRSNPSDHACLIDAAAAAAAAGCAKGVRQRWRQQ
jgi:hypothetical protein